MEPNQTQNPIQSTNSTQPTQPSPSGAMNTVYPPAQEKSSIGSIIATVIIIAIIILGGLYFWGKRIETQNENTSAMMQNTDTTNSNATETAATAESMKIQTVSNDSSMSSIESDLKTTNTTNLGAEVNSL